VQLHCIVSEKSSVNIDEAYVRRPSEELVSLYLMYRLSMCNVVSSSTVYFLSLYCAVLCITIQHILHILHIQQYRCCIVYHKSTLCLCALTNTVPPPAVSTQSDVDRFQEC